MTAYRHGERESALIGVDPAIGSASFTADDEALLERVSAYFAARGFEVERETDPTCDSLWITPPNSINPTWIIIRQYDGRYELQDGLLTVERRGEVLETVLLPEWLLPIAAHSGSP